mgnify:CR=1 FL=1
MIRVAESLWKIPAQDSMEPNLNPISQRSSTVPSKELQIERIQNPEC